MGMKVEKYLTDVLQQVKEITGLEGEFAVVKNWEQGPLPVQRCHIISVYYIDKERTTLVHRTRICSTTINNDEAYYNTFTEALGYIIVNWEEIWNLINTKPQ